MDKETKARIKIRLSDPMIHFSERLILGHMFNTWCSENNVDSTSILSAIVWLDSIGALFISRLHWIAYKNEYLLDLYESEKPAEPEKSKGEKT